MGMCLSIAIAQPPVISLQPVAIIAGSSTRCVRIAAEPVGFNRTDAPVPVVAFLLVPVELIHDGVIFGEYWIER